MSAVWGAACSTELSSGGDQCEREKRVFIVGGGNSAGQAAMFFSNYAAEVKVSGAWRRFEAKHVAISDW